MTGQSQVPQVIKAVELKNWRVWDFFTSEDWVLQGEQFHRPTQEETLQRPKSGVSTREGQVLYKALSGPWGQGRRKRGGLISPS